MRFLVAIVLVLAAISFVVSNAIGQTYIPLVASGPATSMPTLTSAPTNTAIPTDTGVPTSTPIFTPTFTPTPTETSVEVSTEMPTSTSTSTLTPTETSTPTATSTNVAVGITVLDNHSTYVDSIDYLHVVGEVRNNTSTNAEYVKIAVNLFNSQGNIVDTSFTYTRLDLLQPSEITCFQVLLDGNPSFSYYEFEISSSDTDEVPLFISLPNYGGDYNQTFDDWYEIVGQARNDNNFNVEYVNIIGTLYNSDNKVIGCGNSYTSAYVLTPGQTSSWKITFTHAPAGTVGTIKAQGQGRAE